MQGTVDSFRRIVLHADDFGMNPVVNQGILTAFREGLLTSTSLLANAPSAENALCEWPDLLSDLQKGRLKSAENRKRVQDPAIDFDLGIHLNLTQGRPLTAERFPAELLDQRGNFAGIGRLFFALKRLRSDRLPLVTAELQAQIEWMCDHGARPTHLNGHQYIELIPAIAAMLPDLIRRFSIPVVRVARERGLFQTVLFRGQLKNWGLGLVKRHFANAYYRTMVRERRGFAEQFFGTSHAGKVDLLTVAAFLNIANKASTIEIGLHPGNPADPIALRHDDPWFDPLYKLRPAELSWLCHIDLVKLLDRSRVSLGRLIQFR